MSTKSLAGWVSVNSHRAVVDGADPGDLVRLDVLADRLDGRLDVGEPVAVLGQPGDRVE